MQSSTQTFGYQCDIISKAIQFINTSSAISHLFVNQSKRKRSNEGSKDSPWCNELIFIETTDLNSVSTLTFCIGRKNWLYPSIYCQWVLWQADRQANKIQVGLKIFKILYRVNYLSFYYFKITAVLLQYQNCISVGFCQVKLGLRYDLKCEKFGLHFFHVNPYTIRHQRT